MRRGRLRGTEEITGHKYESIGEWLQRAATHAEALTQVLASDLHLSQWKSMSSGHSCKKRLPPGSERRRALGMPGDRPRESLRPRVCHRPAF